MIVGWRGLLLRAGGDRSVHSSRTRCLFDTRYCIRMYAYVWSKMQQKCMAMHDQPFELYQAAAN